LNNSPFWTNIVANSSDVVFTDISIRAISHTFSFEKNTDGWDIIQSNNIVIQNSTVTNGDGESPSSRLTNNTDPFIDCVSFKPNATNILVQNLSCNGTHGISVGSLGQYPERIDIVENILVRNISMYNSSEGARIKVWPDAFNEKSANLKGGGGSGSVRNVTYDGMWLDNVDYGITITQCYGQDDEEECFKHPVSAHKCPYRPSAIRCILLPTHLNRHASTSPISPLRIFAAGLTEFSRLLLLTWSALALRRVPIFERRISTSAASMVHTKPPAAMLIMLC
jgi:polygalacturonase